MKRLKHGVIFVCLVKGIEQLRFGDNISYKHINFYQFKVLLFCIKKKVWNVLSTINNGNPKMLLFSCSLPLILDFSVVFASDRTLGIHPILSSTPCTPFTASLYSMACWKVKSECRIIFRVGKYVYIFGRLKKLG